MTRELLREGARDMGLMLDEAQLEQFRLYREYLEKAGKTLNLTAIEGERMIPLHFLDSLAGATFLPREPGATILDVGSGAGFPGLPLKIYRPDLHLHILDASRKRLIFTEGLLRYLQVKGVRLFHGRAEEYGRREGFRGAYTWVTARALAPLPVLLELCLPFCCRGGLFCAYKGPGISREMEESSHALSLLRGRIVRDHALTLPQCGAGRRLLIVEKAGDTPEAYPRRPGIPARRPLVPNRARGGAGDEL